MGRQGRVLGKKTGLGTDVPGVREEMVWLLRGFQLEMRKA